MSCGKCQERRPFAELPELIKVDGNGNRGFEAILAKQLDDMVERIGSKILTYHSDILTLHHGMMDICMEMREVTRELDGDVKRLEESLSMSNTQAKAAVDLEQAHQSISDVRDTAQHDDGIKMAANADPLAMHPLESDAVFIDTSTPQKKTHKPKTKQTGNDASLNSSTSASSKLQKAVDTPNANQGSNDAFPNPAAVGEPDGEAAIDATMSELCDKLSQGSQESGDKQIDHFDPGIVTLEIVEARGLHGADNSANGTRLSDPYVRVYLRNRSDIRKRRAVYRTHTKFKTVDPVWNEVCNFEAGPDLTEISLELWDSDTFSSDDLLGRVTLQPADILHDKAGMENWFAISPQWDCPYAAGQVLLKASFQSNEKAMGTQAYLALQGWSSANLEKEIEHKNRERNFFSHFVDNKRFDSVFCGLIVLNALVMLVELEYNGRKSMAFIGLDEPGSNSSPVFESILYGFNVFFSAIFLFELCCRLAAFGRHFFKSPANWLDFVIVAGSIIDVVGVEFMNLTFLRLMRLTKLARLLKAAMMSTFCEPLRILFSAIRTSFGYLFWSFVFLGMCQMISALLLTQLLADYLVDENLDLDIRRFIYTYYGTTSRTWLTMFQMTMSTGAWGVLARPIIEKVDSAFAIFFVAYVGGVSFAMIRIITALFLRKTLQTAIADEQTVQNQKIREKREASENIRDQWNALDPTGQISHAKFEKLLKTAEGHTWLIKLELDYSNACCIFDLMHDGSGTLNLDEFLGGVFRMAAPLKQVDAVLIQQESKKAGKMIEGLQTQLTEVLLLCQQRSENFTIDLKCAAG